MQFTKNNSQAMKGLAICLLLFHHAFYAESNWAGFTVQFLLVSKDVAITLGQFARVCVPMFVFVTAYGMAYKLKSSRLSLGETSKMVVKRYLSLIFPFWFVFIISQIACNLAGIRTFHAVYGHGLKSLIKFAADGLGVSSLLGFNTLNPTWWYMSLAVVLIILMPFIAKATTKFGYLITVILIAATRLAGVSRTWYWNYLIIAFLGSSMCWDNPFEKIERIVDKRKSKDVVVLLACMAAIVVGYFVKLPKTYTDIEYCLVVPAIAIIIQRYIPKLKVISKGLELLGKYSMNIFLTHTFILQFFLHDQIYSLKYSILIWLALLILSTLLAWAISKLYESCKIDRLKAKIANRI